MPALALAVAGCSHQTASSFDGHFVGTVTPAGSGGAASDVMLCQGVTRGEIDIAGPHFDFAPNEGTIVMHGTTAPTGALAASLGLPGGGHQTYAVRFTGKVQGGTITGRLMTPECQAAVSLRRH